MKEKAKIIFCTGHLVMVLYYFGSILSAEFIRASLQDAAEKDGIILSKAKAKASLPMNGKDDEVRLCLHIYFSQCFFFNFLLLL